MTETTTPPEQSDLQKRLERYRQMSKIHGSVIVDPVGPNQPHTPRPNELPDANRPTCSAPGEKNKGCEAYGYCRLPQKMSNAGPCQLIVEDHRGLDPGQGRRWPSWCFVVFRQILGEHKREEHSIAKDRVFEQRGPEGWGIVRMPAPEDQGPYHWKQEAAAALPEMADLRAQFLLEEEAKEGIVREQTALGQAREAFKDESDGD